jgi:tetratricopeptide (TPR) repeat protein
MAIVLLPALGFAATRFPDRADAQEQGREPEAEALPEDLAQTITELSEQAAESEDPRDWYNLGTAYLSGRRWPEAREELTRAADTGEGKVARFSRYNLGMANGMEGHPDGEASDDERRQRLVSARDAFREVLREDPEDPNTRWNLELVNRWLEEMSAAGGGSSQDQEQDQGGAGGSAGQQGPAEPGGQAPSLTREEAEQLLQQAAGAEEEVRDKTLRRGRLRDPVVERNW